MPPRLLPTFLLETRKTKTKRTNTDGYGKTTSEPKAAGWKKLEPQRDATKHRHTEEQAKPKETSNKKRKAYAHIQENYVDVDGMELDQDHGDDYFKARKLPKYIPDHTASITMEIQNDVVMDASMHSSNAALYQAAARANSNLFLGIYVYFGTVTTHNQDEMADAILSHSGQITNDLNSYTTHYVCDVSLSPDESNAILSAYPQLAIVNSKWLIQSIFRNELLDEFQYS
jgi:hypothetical protein